MAYNKLQDDGLVYLEYIIQDHLVSKQLPQPKSVFVK